MANDVVIKIRADGVERTEQQVSKLTGSIEHLGTRTESAGSAFLRSAHNLLPFGSALNRTLNAAESTARGLERTAASSSKLPFIFASGGIAAIALGMGLANLFSKTIAFSSSLQQNEIAFKTMTGSVDIARQHLTDLKQFALETPFQFGDLVEYSRRLQAMGVETKDVVETLRTLGNVAAGVGMEKLPQLILAFGQVKAAGHLTGMELRQFTEAGVPLLGELATAYGVTTSEMQEMISEGRVGFESIRFVMEEMTAEGGRIGPQMQEQQRTFATATSNIQDSLLQLGDEGFKPLFTGITETALAFSDFLQTDEAKNFASEMNTLLTGIGNTASWLKDRFDESRVARDLFFNPKGFVTDAILQKMNELNQEQREMASWPQWIDISNPAGQPLQGPPIPEPEDLAVGLESIRKARILPPLLPGESKDGGTAGAARQAVEALKEMLPVMEQLNRANAFKVWREDMKAILAAGGIEEVIAGYEALGWTVKDTAQEIIRMSQENEDAAEKMATANRKLAEDAKRRFGEEQDAERRRAVEEAGRIVQGQADAITASLAKGGTLEQGLAAFAEAEWIKGMGVQIKAALAAGLTPDPDLIAAYQNAITNTMDIQVQKAQETADAVKQAAKDAVDYQIDMSNKWKKQLEDDADWEYRDRQEAMRRAIDLENQKARELMAIGDAMRSQGERQARAEKLEEISTEIGFQEFRLRQLSPGGAPLSAEARELREMIRLMRLQLQATEKGQTVDGQVLSGVASRRTGSDAIVWARVGGD